MRTKLPETLAVDAERRWRPKSSSTAQAFQTGPRRESGLLHGRIQKAPFDAQPGALEMTDRSRKKGPINLNPCGRRRSTALPVGYSGRWIRETLP